MKSQYRRLHEDLRQRNYYQVSRFSIFPVAFIQISFQIMSCRNKYNITWSQIKHSREHRSLDTHQVIFDAGSPGASIGSTLLACMWCPEIARLAPLPPQVSSLHEWAGGCTWRVGIARGNYQPTWITNRKIINAGK